ncbi:MAG: hypothetical protein IJT37_09770 [Lachnospiraceae bacterium]|nr:hypothetical protein [Lachnospiraceae bacterium]
MVPVASEYDTGSNTIIAQNTNTGTYVLVDMEKWLEYLGFDIVDDSIDNNDETINSVIEITDGDNKREYGTASVKEDELKQELRVSKGTSLLKSSSDTDTPRLWDYSINTPEHIVPGEMEADIVFCINNKIDAINPTEFEAIKSNILLIGDTVFKCNKRARIYIIDQNGDLVKGASDSECATNSANLKIMLNKVENIEATEMYIEPQLHTLVIDIPFRETAYRAAYFFGNTYRTFESELYSYDIARINVRCIINNPYTATDSWYDTLSQRTKGLLLYNYVDFADDAIAFMYGSTDVYELHNYNMISSAGIKKISLKDRLNIHSNIDTDEDTLSDWSEINTEQITVDDNGNAVLPTYFDYLNMYYKDKYNDWKKQYRRLRDRNGRNLDDMLSEVIVLPVLSDPTMKDSDGDGINDNIERTQNAIDKRYECLGAFHEDTIETIYPELSDPYFNNDNYPTYITVNGNDVTMHLKVVFKGDYNVKSDTVLNTNVSDSSTLIEINNISNRIGSAPTLKELAIDGLKTRWERQYVGNLYDFCEGLTIGFSIDIIEIPDIIFKNAVTLDFRSGVCGFSFNENGEWRTHKNKHIFIYTSYCIDENHIDTDGSQCQSYKEQWYNEASFEGTVAHEFGHAMGLYDLYPKAKKNHEFTINSNQEITYVPPSLGIPSSIGITTSGEIMGTSGCPTANDIEMVLIAFSEDEMQYYIPYGEEQRISKAIKHPIQFKNERDLNVLYRWNEQTYSFQVI